LPETPFSATPRSMAFKFFRDFVNALDRTGEDES
jgi:hypothetical protein